MIREVAILTKSSKNGGHCVAGIDLENSKWIRLVSDNEDTHGALSNEDIKYSSCGYCQPLDVVRVAVKQYDPTKRQPENALIDSTKRWEKIRTIRIEDVRKIHHAEQHDFLFGDTNAFITEAVINTLNHSLVLVEVTNFTIVQHVEPRRKTKANFTYRGNQYSNMSVTDPKYYSTPDLWHTEKAMLVISLPDSPLDGNQYYKEKRYYKFVSKIFPI